MTDAASWIGRSSDLLLHRPSDEAIEWASRVVGGAARVLSVEPLPGGQTHANHLLRISSRGAIYEVVLRRWVRPDWQETDPQLSPAQEVATYDLLASSEVPAPRLLAADIAGCECDVPALLLTRAPGTRLTKPAEMRSFLQELAAALPLVHAIDPARASRTVPSYRPYYVRDRPSVPVWARSPFAWERALEAADGTEPSEPRAFIHRDYHPGNTLWVSGRLTAIVDWTTASFGSPAVDLAHMRANLAMSFAVDTADAFLDAYRTVAGAPYVHDPYWDLRVAVDFLPDLRWHNRPTAELARLDDFVARAVARL